MLAFITLFALFHTSYAFILSRVPVHVKEPFKGRVASAHLHHNSAINARPKPKHPPPKQNTQ